VILLKEQISQNIAVAIWQIAESEKFFFNRLQLLPEDESKIRDIQLQQLRLQKLACRMALAELLGKRKIEITYAETGQPQVQGHCISFSHKKNSVAVALANIPVGIDIEELSPRITNLYPRFMSSEEIAECDLYNLQDLYFYWCAKESMYKWFANQNLDFIEDLRVKKNENKGIVCKKHTLQFVSFYLENEMVVVCYEGKPFLSF
jgi:phosphopantetheinyl transferase